MPAVLKSHVLANKVPDLLEQMEADGFELDTIREHHNLTGQFWLLFRQPHHMSVKEADRLHNEQGLSRKGEQEQADRNEIVSPK